MKSDQELQKTPPAEEISDKCLEALLEKDRLSYLGRFVQGIIHNINGPLQNMSMLSEILLKGQDNMDALFRASNADGLDGWDDLSQKQRKRLDQLTRQIAGLADMLRDFMSLHEIERNETEVDVNLVMCKLANVFRSDLFFKHQVTLDLQLARNLPLVRILGRHLIPSLVHVIQNALVAMRNAPEKRLVIESGLTEGNIRLGFADSGCGISKRCPSQEDLFQLFSSWWETDGSRPSAEEKHLGFGLYAVRRMLSPYGVIVCMEETGQGVLTTLDIPIG